MNKSIIHYYKYFYNLIGGQLFWLQLLNAFVGLLDGLGLIMFIPLLSASGVEHSNVGKLQFLFDFFERIGIALSLRNVLLIMLAFFCIKALLIHIKDLYNVKINQRGVKKIRYNLLDHLHYSNYRNYTSAEPGKIQHVLTAEITKTVAAMRHFNATLHSLVVLIVYLLLAFIANWKFALMVITGGLLTGLIYNYINKYSVKKSKEISVLGIKFNTYLVQVLQNYKYLKVTNLLGTYNQNLKKIIEEVQDENYELGRLNSIVSVIREPLIVIIIAIVILVYVEGFHYSMSGIVVSLLLFYRSLNYMMGLQISWNAFLKDSVSIGILDNLLEFLEQDKEPQQKHNNFSIDSITLNEINLNYGNSSVLKNINIDIQAKQSIALVGESGAGKTSLANIISGLVKADSGNLLINNRLLNDDELHSYRSKVGYVIQESAVFNDTIYNNVTFWAVKTEENLDRFYECLKIVHLFDFVKELEEEEDSHIGSNGILLSGGQRQRISLARELYRNVDIIVLDEATSALDSTTENIIQKNLERLKGQYTMIIIAHRLSTIKSVDKIYLMKAGKILDSGSYEELYKSSEIFKGMVDLQEL